MPRYFIHAIGFISKLHHIVVMEDGEVYGVSRAGVASRMPMPVPFDSYAEAGRWLEVMEEPPLPDPEDP